MSIACIPSITIATTGPEVRYWTSASVTSLPSFALSFVPSTSSTVTSRLSKPGYRLVAETIHPGFVTHRIMLSNHFLCWRYHFYSNYLETYLFKPMYNIHRSHRRFTPFRLYHCEGPLKFDFCNYWMCSHY